MRARPTGNASPARRPTAARCFTLIELLIVVAIILLLSAITVTVIVGIQSRTEVRDTENTMRLLDQALVEWELAMGRQVTFGRSANFPNINSTEPNCSNVPVAQQPRYELPQLVAGGSTWGSDQDAAADALMTTDMLWSLLRRAAPAADIVTRVNPDYMVELDPGPDGAPVLSYFGVNDLEHLRDYMNGRLSFRFLDAWDNPIVAVLPGRPYQRAIGGCQEDVAYCPAGVSAPCPDDDGTIRTPFENRYGVAVNRRIYFVSAGPSGRFGNLHLNTSSANLTEQQHDDIRDASDNIYSYEVYIEEARP